MKMRNVMTLALVALSLVFVGCDKKDDVKETIKKSKTIDATKYDMWTYVNLETGQTETHRDFSEWHVMKNGKLLETIPAKGSEADIKIKWHIAIHRFDIRTNEGEAIATKETEFSKVTGLPAGDYKKDVEIKDKMLVGFNMADMMKRKFIVAGMAKVNPVLKTWIVENPMGKAPVLSKSVFVVKFKDGSYAKIKFTDATNDKQEKGHVSFNYEFQPK
ncbi:HmuY family protein [Tannerella forsythia]|uniref:HmuY family protein n=1 Tax=Tannerella forsythia TaxID=28112 RepID=UPI000945B0FF|nr:HmuY family protein [Tannerella forsythia]